MILAFYLRLILFWCMTDKFEFNWSEEIPLFYLLLCNNISENINRLPTFVLTNNTKSHSILWEDSFLLSKMLNVETQKLVLGGGGHKDDSSPPPFSYFLTLEASFCSSVEMVNFCTMKIVFFIKINNKRHEQWLWRSREILVEIPNHNLLPIQIAPSTRSQAVRMYAEIAKKFFQSMIPSLYSERNSLDLSNNNFTVTFTDAKLLKYHNFCDTAY